MAEKETKSSSEEIKLVEEIKEEDKTAAAAEEAKSPPTQSGGGGGWGGWGFSPLSYLSDLQKAATVAAEEISRNVLSLLLISEFFLSF